MVGGKRLTVDITAVRANASSQRRVLREELGDLAKLSRTVGEYLGEVEQENPVADPGDRQPTPTSTAARFVSTTDPEACWAGQALKLLLEEIHGGPLAYFEVVGLTREGDLSNVSGRETYLIALCAR